MRDIASVSVLMFLDARNRNTPLKVAKMKTLIVSCHRKYRGRAVVGSLNSGLGDIMENLSSFDLSTLPCSAFASVLQSPRWPPQLQAAYPHTTITKCWWKKGVGFSSRGGVFSLTSASLVNFPSIPSVRIGTVLCPAAGEAGKINMWQRELGYLAKKN